MKLFIKHILLISILITAHHAIAAHGFRIYGQEQTKPMAIQIYKGLINKGIPKELIKIVYKKSPCQIINEASFMDLCIEKTGQIKILRKSYFFSQTTKPLIK